MTTLAAILAIIAGALIVLDNTNEERRKRDGEEE